MHMLILVANLFTATQTVSTQYIVSDTVTCHTRELTQGSGTVRICEYSKPRPARAR